MLILERLIAGLKDACAAFPDARTGDAVYSMADVGLPAFSLFFMQSESFLAYQRSLEDERKTSNCRSLFGMAKIPTDATIRSLLDPVHPRHLQGSFDQALAVMRERSGMKAFERLGGRVLIVFDGTEFFCSQKLGCAHRIAGRDPSRIASARRASATTARQTITTPCWRPALSRPATTWCCR